MYETTDGYTIPNNGAHTKSLDTRLSAGTSNLDVYGPLTVMHSRNTTSPQDTTILHLWPIKLYRAYFLEDGGGVQGPPLPTPSQTSSE